MRTLTTTLAVLMLLAVGFASDPAHAKDNVDPETLALLDGKGFVCRPIPHNDVRRTSPLKFLATGELQGAVYIFDGAREGTVGTWGTGEGRFLSHAITYASANNAYIAFRYQVTETSESGRLVINRTTLDMTNLDADFPPSKKSCTMNSAKEARKIIEDLYQEWLSKRRI